MIRVLSCIMKEKATLKSILLFTFIFGFFVHGYRFLNMNLTHDSLGILFPKDLGDFMSSIGRFSYGIFYNIIRIYSEPLFLGEISLLVIGFGCFFIARIFDLNKIGGILISAVVTVSVPFTLFSATYIGSLPIFSFSFLFSVLSVYLVRKGEKKYFLGAIFLLAFAMGGEDQSIIQFAIALFILIIIKNILNEDKKILYNVTLFSVFLLVSGFAYLILYKLSFIILNLSPSSGYNSLEHINIGNIFKNIMNLNFLKDAYCLPIKFFVSKNELRGGVEYPLPTLFRLSSIFIYLLCLIYPLFLTVRKKLNKKYLFVYFVVLMLSPLAVNSVYFISNGLVHDLMKLSYYFIVILGIIFIDIILKNEVCLFNSGDIKLQTNSYYRIMLLIPFFCIIFISLLFAKNIYFVKELQFNYVKQTVNRVLVNIENTDGYIPNETKVIFIGTLDSNKICNSTLNLLPENAGLRGALGYGGVFIGYISKFLGYKLNIVKYIDSISFIENLDNIREINFSKEDVKFIRSSPVFPQRGYVFFVNDILIVKLSNL